MWHLKCPIPIYSEELTPSAALQHFTIKYSVHIHKSKPRDKMGVFMETTENLNKMAMRLETNTLSIVIVFYKIASLIK